MIKRIITTITAIFLVTPILGNSLFAGDKLVGAGASFPAPLYYDWAYVYKKKTGNRINYQSIGSGGGIEQISKRMVDFGASDKPLKSEDLAKDKLLQFPAVIGSIVIVFNIPSIGDAQLKLKNSVVADIFSGEISKWNDPRITSDNPNLKLPNEPITVVHRSDGSGTTYNFSYYLSGSSSDWKSRVGTGKSLDWPVGLGGKGNEGVTNLVKQTPFSIGYVEQAYKSRNNMSAAILQTASGKWVEAKEENFKSAAAYAKWTIEDNFYQMLALQPGDHSYPIVAATFILLPIEKSDTNSQVTAFYEYSFEKGDKSADRLGYIALPEATKNMIRKYWKKHGVDPK
jgi:phosphate transport system substrate-binding protein